MLFCSLSLPFWAAKPELPGFLDYKAQLSSEELNYWAPELLGSWAPRPFLRSYALKIELLGSGAPRPFLSSYALKTKLLGSGALRPFFEQLCSKN